MVSLRISKEQDYRLTYRTPRARTALHAPTLVYIRATVDKPKPRKQRRSKGQKTE